MILSKPLGQISKEDLESVVAAQVPEGQQIEYKQALPGNADGEKKEFLADVSSFANSAGGHLVYGVLEKRDASGKTTGLPEGINGLAGVNAGAEILRLENVIRDGIEPRLPAARLRQVDGFAAGPVIVIEVPRSWASPHVVKFANHGRFYARNAAGKFQLDVQELRAALAHAPDGAGRCSTVRERENPCEVSSDRGGEGDRVRRRDNLGVNTPRAETCGKPPLSTYRPARGTSRPSATPVVS